jgi:hypothetical protein
LVGYHGLSKEGFSSNDDKKNQFSFPKLNLKFFIVDRLLTLFSNPPPLSGLQAEINTGIMQGDGLSPILFNFIIPINSGKI